MFKNIKTYGFIWILLLGAGAQGNEQDLRIYLPSEKTVESAAPQLGQIALVLGDPSLVRTAEAVGVGKFAAAGQQLTIDRATVLSCLASAGIASGRVQFNGAESVSVKRLEQTIDADRFVQTARAFLQGRTEEQKASLKVVRGAQDVVLADAASDIMLQARLSGTQSRGTRRVTVAVMRDATEIGHQDVVFGLQYERKRIVAAERFEAGTEVTAENTRVETYTASVPEEGGGFSPYGMAASKVIEAGTAIEPGSVEPKTPPVLIKRQQQVVLKIDTDVMLVSAYGEAMEDGRAGDLIRVRRGSRSTNDERFVIGRVMQDGTVRPVLN